MNTELPTPTRILDAALVTFAARGFEATSLDALAASLGVRKQTILHHFGSKDQLLVAVLNRTVGEFVVVIDSALADAGSAAEMTGANQAIAATGATGATGASEAGGSSERGQLPGWSALESVVRAVFSTAGRRPELLGFLREMGRLGAPHDAALAAALSPLVDRATTFLRTGLGPRPRSHDPQATVVAAYAAVLGAITEIEVLRRLQQEPSARLLVRRRRELLSYLSDLLGVARS